MRQLITVTLLIAMSSSLFAQQVTTSRSFTEEDYMKKSRHQKTVAWILIGGSVIMYSAALTAATVDGLAQVNHDLWGIVDPDRPPVKKNTATITATAIAGTVALFASIPFFSAAARNKKLAHAMSFSFKPEKVFLVQNASLVPQFVPALSLKINL